MPARNRVKIYVPDTYYHLYNRGVEKRTIFEDEIDYKTFLTYVKEALSPPPDKKELLTETTFKGRFSTGRTVWLMPIYEGFFRWTPGQQRTFAGVLESVTREKKRDNPALMFAIDQLAALPDVPPEALISRARSTKPFVRDAALRALARVDGGKGVDELVAALNDERARIAIYALRGAVMEMPEPAAIVTGLIGVVAVVPSMRRRGIARAMFLHVLRWLKEHRHERVALAVTVENTPALSLYSSLGFQEVGPNSTISVWRRSVSRPLMNFSR